MMPQDFTEQLLNAAMASNDGVLSPMAMQAAERLKSREEGIADLRAQLAAAEADKLAAMERVREAAANIVERNGHSLHIEIRALKLDALAEEEK